MEGDRRLQVILIFVATAIFALSYIIGYMVGKEAGFQEAKAKFEVEKQRLLKTLAEISPVSRPIEDKVVSEKTEEETEGETEEREEEGKVEESKESQKQEESGKQDDSSILAPLFQKTQPKPEVQPKPVQPKPQVVEREEEEDRFYLQVGVFRNKINASRLAEKLREKGYEAKTVTHHGKYIKVIVGYFSSKEDALKVKEELKKDGYNSILRRR